MRNLQLLSIVSSRQLVMHVGEMGATAEADPPELEQTSQRFPEGTPLRRSGSYLTHPSLWARAS